MLLTLPIFTSAQDLPEIQLANEYLLKGDKNKALELYRDLAKNEQNVTLIHNNYLNALIDASHFDEAQSYLKKKFKARPR